MNIHVRVMAFHQINCSSCHSEQLCEVDTMLLFYSLEIVGDARRGLRSIDLDLPEPIARLCKGFPEQEDGLQPLPQPPDHFHPRQLGALANVLIFARRRSN